MNTNFNNLSEKYFLDINRKTVLEVKKVNCFAISESTKKQWRDYVIY